MAQAVCVCVCVSSLGWGGRWQPGRRDPQSKVVEMMSVSCTPRIHSYRPQLDTDCVLCERARASEMDRGERDSQGFVLKKHHALVKLPFRNRKSFLLLLCFSKRLLCFMAFRLYFLDMVKVTQGKEDSRRWGVGSFFSITGDYDQH